MVDLSEAIYMCANVVAAAKERAIMDALNHHFGKKDWTEAEVAELDLTSSIDPVGRTETLYINHKPYIKFGPIGCHTEIETGMVQCLFAQTIEPLYGCCGVG